MTIADKILRAKNDYDNVYMAGERTGYDNGYDDGYDDGYDNGYDIGNSAGYDDGFVKGHLAAYDAFWDELQGEGRRKNYTGGFEGIGWTEITLRPKYDMKCEAANRMFRMCRVKQPFPKYFTDQNINIDFSNCTRMEQCFASSFFTDIDIDTRAATDLTDLFASCKHLVSVNVRLKDDGSQDLNNLFGNCTELQNVNIQGKIDYFGFRISTNLKLTAESIVNIFNSLSDVSKSQARRIMYMGDNINKLTSEQIAIATNKGWTLK